MYEHYLLGATLRALPGAPEVDETQRHADGRRDQERRDLLEIARLTAENESLAARLRQSEEREADLRDQLAAAWRAQDLTHGHMERLAKEDAETRVALGCPADDRSTSEGARLISGALSDAHAMLDERDTEMDQMRASLRHSEEEREALRKAAQAVADDAQVNNVRRDRLQVRTSLIANLLTTLAALTPRQQGAAHG